MAADLASTPVTGIRVQACGDCHAANFGGFGTPERQLVFDINDFDETLPAPWEWYVKRLAASIILAMREAGVAEHRCSDAARTSARSYRKHMREYAGMTALEVWYSHLSADLFIRNAETPEARKRWQKLEAKATMDTSGHEFPKITAMRHGHLRIIDRPPLIYHPHGYAGFRESVCVNYFNGIAKPCPKNAAPFSVVTSLSTSRAKSWEWAASGRVVRLHC